ncbi:MAG TPA: ANTAR domain-containing protein [Burkholderiaceae bacterium]
MTPQLLVALPADTAADAPPDAWQPALAAAGAAFETIACDTLVRRCAELAPQQILIYLPGPHALGAVRDALQAWAGVPPCPLLLIGTAALAPAAQAELAALGAHAWLDAGALDAPALQAACARAQARWQRERELRAELERLRTQLDERKWVDRAKGLLMAARGIDEDDAFRMLRGAAMHANLRLGEVSRAIVEAAQWAEAINRAGQLRMLSQRLVLLAAQTLAGIDARGARTRRKEAGDRVRQTLEHLAGLALDAAAGRALEHVQASWRSLEAALAPRLSGETLADIDVRAEALLDAADALTTALEASGARRALRIVNLCGRQRMRVQRLAKDALLGAMLPGGPWRERLAPTMREFEVVLAELEHAPLSSPEIRAGLAAARDEWLQLMRGVAAVDRAEGRSQLVRASDSLVDAFDALTASYEHSLQVVMS